MADKAPKIFIFRDIPTSLKSPHFFWSDRTGLDRSSQKLPGMDKFQVNGCAVIWIARSFSEILFNINLTS